MRHLGFLAALAVGTFFVATGGCKSSHEEGVTSNLHTQWTDVMADTAGTTDAAKAVLSDEGLKDVKGQSTNVDGSVTGKKADGTKVMVTVKKVSDKKSQASVNIGTVGDPKLGAELAKKIKMRAEGGMMSSEPKM